MFSPQHLDFHFPLFTTCVHMLVQFSLAAAVLCFVPRFRPRHDAAALRDAGDTGADNAAAADNDDCDYSSDGSAKKKKSPPLMTKRFYVTRIAPCAGATGLDIGLGNMSLKFVTLSFYSEAFHYTPRFALFP
jgi:solute carrier family 35 protein C2